MKFKTSFFNHEIQNKSKQKCQKSKSKTKFEKKTNLQPNLEKSKIEKSKPNLEKHIKTKCQNKTANQHVKQIKATFNKKNMSRTKTQITMIVVEHIHPIQNERRTTKLQD